ncbi:MAG: hemerythrin domain-containing protein [Sulfuricella sp.]
MKRHVALLSLSREHHGALVLALACRRAASSGDAEKIRETCGRAVREFDADLAPHFRREETALLPLLQQAGQTALVRRTLEEHASLRALAESLRQRDVAVLEVFGQALSDHVRFEEQALFPAVERAVPSGLLEAALSSQDELAKTDNLLRDN